MVIIQKTVKQAVTILLCLALSLSFTMMSPIPSFASELDDAAAALEEAKTKCEEAIGKQEELQGQITTLEASIAEIEAVLPQQQRDAADAVRDMYMTGGDKGFEISLIEMALSSNSFSSMIRNIEYMMNIYEMRCDALEASYNSKKDLEAQREELLAAKTEIDAAVEEANAAKEDAQEKYNKAQAAAASVPKTSSVNAAPAGGGYLTLQQMKFQGVVYYAGYRYTYYSQSVLPGNGLSIPGRHVEGGCVVDGDGYICVASSTHAKGTVVPTPLAQFPYGKVYDCGCAAGTIDLYIA